MKLGFSTLGCPEWKFKEIVSNSLDLGFSGVEIRGIASEIYAPKIKELSVLTKEELKENLKGLEIVILTSASYLHLEEKYVSEAKEYIDTASKYEIPYIRVLGDTEGRKGENVDTDLVKERLITLAQYAKDKNVSVLIETNGVFANSQFLKEFLDDINLDNIGVIWDVHHPYVYFNEQPETTYNNLAKYIKHVHIKDSKIEDGKIVYKILGKGELPIKEFIKILKNNDYSGYMMLEWLRRWNKDLEEGGIVFYQYAHYMNKLISEC